MMRCASEGQRLAPTINPCPLMSGGVEDCIAKGRDLMAGGARYNASTISYISVGTTIDSLAAIRAAVYEDRRVTLAELACHVADDFAGAEPLAAYIRELPKFGHGDARADGLAERISLDLMQAACDLPQGRGGHTEPGYFTYTAFATMGGACGATPDGRRAGQPFSQGTGPSRLRYPDSPTDPICSQEALHLDLAPGCGVLDVYLPLSRAAGMEPKWVRWLMKGFMAKGGSVLQFGVMDPETLRDAQDHPENYPELQVRVSGFTARFASLSRDVQDEVIGRMRG
jgi:formate C-acetyltransferase